MNVLKPYLRGWIIIIASMTIAYLMANKYLNYTTPMYESTAKLRLADIGEGVPNSNLFKDLDVFATTQKLNAEIEVLKSHILLEKMLTKLNFDKQIFRVGSIKRKELYTDSPIQLTTWDVSRTFTDRTFALAVHNKSTFTITSDKGQVTNGKMGDTLSIEGNKLMVSINEKLLKQNKALQIADKYEFIINSKQKLISEISKQIDITPVDKDIAVVRISYKSAQPEKAALLPNALAEAYIQDYIEMKYNAANITVHFLDDRIHEVSRKLTQVENNILDYRNQRGITNISQQTETDLRKISQLKIQQTNLKMSLDAVKSLEAYMASGKNDFMSLAPNFEAFTDLLSTEMIKKIKQLQAEKRDLELQYTPNDDRVSIIDKKLHDLTSYLMESISNTRKNLQVKYNNLATDIEEAEKVFIDVPEKEKMLNILNREFNIFQQSYNFLNEKKIEAEIAKAAKIAFHRVITPAYVSKEPVSPNRAIIKIVATMLGLIGSVILIAIVHSLKARVNGTNTIEANSMIPIAAAIPKLKTNREQETFFLKMIAQWEVKNLIIPQGIIAINGFSIKEGAQFITRSMMASFELQERNTLLIDFHKAIFPHLANDLVPQAINQYVSVINIDDQAIKQLSAEKLQQFLQKYSQEYEHIIILNDGLDSQFCLPVMATATLNIMVLDARLTPAKKIETINLLKDEYNLANIYFVINRLGYNPSLVKELFKESKKWLTYLITLKKTWKYA